MIQNAIFPFWLSKNVLIVHLLNNQDYVSLNNLEFTWKGENNITKSWLQKKIVTNIMCFKYVLKNRFITLFNEPTLLYFQNYCQGHF